jgi:hypothetical protein
MAFLAVPDVGHALVYVMHQWSDLRVFLAK